MVLIRTVIHHTMDESSDEHQVTLIPTKILLHFSHTYLHMLFIILTQEAISICTITLGHIIFFCSPLTHHNMTFYHWNIWLIFWIVSLASLFIFYVFISFEPWIVHRYIGVYSVMSAVKFFLSPVINGDYLFLNIRFTKVFSMGPKYRKR